MGGGVRNETEDKKETRKMRKRNEIDDKNEEDHGRPRERKRRRRQTAAPTE